MQTSSEDFFYIHDEKNKFTPKEFLKAQIAAAFIVDFTKVICRKGDNDSEHVNSRVKRGLFSSFQKAIGDADEITITCRGSGEKADLFIIGILDEPVSMRRVTKTTTATVFIPKLKDYFERIGVASITIKRQITPENLDSFVDIACETAVDFKDEARINDYLTRALVDARISDVSMVFDKDVVLPARRLPWRVEITLCRLVKDLKVIPMYHHPTIVDTKKINIKTIHDIFQPLKHADLLKDIIINNDVVSSNVAHLTAEELEELVVHSIPTDMLLFTTRFVYEEYEKLKKEFDADEKQFLREQCNNLEKILRIAGQRIISEKLRESYELLEGLYNYGLITFESLPRDHILSQLRQRINTSKSSERSGIRKWWLKKNPEDFILL